MNTWCQALSSIGGTFRSLIVVWPSELHVVFLEDLNVLVHPRVDDRYVPVASNHSAKPIFVPMETRRRREFNPLLPSFRLLDRFRRVLVDCSVRHSFKYENRMREEVEVSMCFTW